MKCVILHIEHLWFASFLLFLLAEHTWTRDDVCAGPPEWATTSARDRLSAQLIVCAQLPERATTYAHEFLSARRRMHVNSTARDDVCARILERATTYAREFLSARRRMRAIASTRDDVYSRRRVSLGACSCIGGANLE